MRDASALPTMTVEEYFRFEESSPIRHEYVAGEVYAMSGATVRHVDAYRSIAALQAYLIVDHRRRRVERHSRDASSGKWLREEIVGEGRVLVPCLDVELTLEEIYERVELPSVGEPEPFGYEIDEYD